MNNRLKVLRAEHEWSQKQIADVLGVSRQTINAIETGKYDPSLPLAFKLADCFHLPIEAIFLPQSIEPVAPATATPTPPDPFALVSPAKEPRAGRANRDPR